MAIYAIGDIHGCHNALVTLFNNIPKNQSDTFVFLGDYVNKGPNSKKSIQFLIDFSKKYDSIFLRGNHDIMMMEARHSLKKHKEWINQGGDATLGSFGVLKDRNWSGKIDASVWNFLEATKKYHQIEKYLFVHAGLEPETTIENQRNENLYWKKYQTPKKYSNENIVICGHTSRRNGEIANFGHTICIDTFASGGQWLTGLNISSGEYYQSNQKMETRKGVLT
jgi:serine/threonine protein phosphatase 1